MAFNDKVVVVTGASSGIGAATAIKFAEQKAKVVIAARTEAKLKEVSEKCKIHGQEPLMIIADVTKDNDIKNIVNATISKYGKIDVLVNNAGIVSLASIWDEKAMEVFDKVMSTNLRSAVLLTNLAAPHLIQTKGNIINMSSIAALDTIAVEHFAYCCSKAAMDHFSRSVALELGPKGVRVNSVNPGPVVTDIINNLGIDKAQQGELWTRMAATMPLKRVGEPEEIGDLVLFLASDKARGITGSTVVTDNETMAFNDKVVIVTGASSGIGAATAIKFAEQKAKVVIVARTEAKLKEVSAECKKHGTEPLMIIADVANDTDVKNIVTTTVAKCGKIDVLVNNAGIAGAAYIWDEKAMEVFDRVMATNLRSTVFLTNLAAPYLVQTKGNIVNISSVAGIDVYSAGRFTYCSSKAGMDHFTRAVAADLGPKGVRANTVNPGPVETDFINNLGVEKSKHGEFWKMMAGTTTLDRVSTAEEIGDLILFLASDKAKGITGSTVVADNGMLLKRNIRIVD